MNVRETECEVMDWIELADVWSSDGLLWRVFWV